MCFGIAGPSLRDALSDKQERLIGSQRVGKRMLPLLDFGDPPIGNYKVTLTWKLGPSQTAQH